MERSLVFEPGELEIIETFEFEEELQRPEELRFFTLEEQLTDYFQKVLPKKKHVLKAEKTKIKKEVDRLKDIYDELIVMTDVDYRVDTARKSVKTDWLKPIYGSFQYEKYSYAQKLVPLFGDSERRTPNAYPRIVGALPRPYRSEGSVGVLIKESTDLVNEEGGEAIHALGTYTHTRRIVKDDGRYEFLEVPVLNTADDVRRIGFFIGERPLEIANPLSDHPFLSSNKATSILTSEPLLDVFPTIDAIMAHAVPVTQDPYGVGQMHLKIYDVKLSEVRWKAWKERFPPADTVSTTATPVSIVFPDSSDPIAPSERVQKVYNSKWLKSIYPRKWLMGQEDAGRLVTKMLLSDAGSFGIIAPDLTNMRPEVQLPESTPGECLNTETFEEFLASGVYRPTADRKSGVCAPVTYTVQERKEMINKDKKAWSETTAENLQKEYVSLFRIFRRPKDETNEVEYEKYKAQDVSELRENVVVLLKDNTLLPPDQAYSIRLLIKELTPVNRKFEDSNGLFVICEHTLALLEGELESNRLKFYNEWAALEDGFRVCKFCGGQINNDNLVAQAEFDDNGRLVVSHDVLPTSSFNTETATSSFASSLTQLKNAFDLNNAGESVLYLLLSQLQVLPNEGQLIPVLSNIREGSVAARKLPPNVKNRFEGLLGIAGTVVLLQTHNPFLIPRRSFGSKVVKLSGFPRDTTDPQDAPALNLIINILKDTLEAFPSTFKEPVLTILRETAGKTRKVKEECVKFLQQAYTKFKPQFEAAKERATQFIETVQVNTLQLPVIVPKKVDFKPGDRRGEETSAECKVIKPMTVVVGKLPPSVMQTSPKLQKTKPSPLAEQVVPIEISLRYTFPAKKDIEKGFKLGFPKSVKLEAIRKFLEGDADGVAVLSLLSRLLDILAPLDFSKSKILKYRSLIDNMNSFENPALFRDAAKGLVYELLHEIESGQIEALKTAMARDLDLNMILLTKEKAEKEVETLRSLERETFKQRMKKLSDKDRETIKLMLDIGIAEYIITNEDRRMFAKELQVKQEFDETEQLDPLEVPEGGFTSRDYVDGDELKNENGNPIEPDRGDYGDVRDRPMDDYSRMYDYDDNGDI